MRRLAITAAVFLTVGSNAFGQTTNRGYVLGFGGPTFGTEPSQIIGGAVGISLTRHLDVVAEVGRMNDILPKSVRRELDETVDDVSREFGVAVQASLKAPATYWTGGVRIRGSSDRGLVPFATVVGGWASIDPKLSLSVGGIPVNITEDELEQAGIKAGRNPVLGLGGGVEISLARRVGVEVGYQFHRIFVEDVDANVHRAYGGLKVKF